jgi:hypothetical protein
MIKGWQGGWSMLCAAADDDDGDDDDDDVDDDDSAGPLDSIDANPGALNPGWCKIISGSALFLLTCVLNVRMP